jgi:hypothetical protein
MTIRVALIGLPQIAVRIDLQDTKARINVRMGPNGAKRSSVFPREGND